eukprot:TRINITY_DN8035_c1_g1_i4.p2 TRINITY_DN8035_c1_g1~~TRINITY_DN8035_c1_g1_i4.p2  ORF type:complete len:372 (-),score=7.45 TRINITY_DN8035_c1_g1_i4:555-1670(-)
MIDDSISRGSAWLASDDDSDTLVENDDIVICCIPWNKEILSQKSPYPKFTVYYTISSQVFVTTLEIVFICGYGTGWYVGGMICVAVAFVSYSLVNIIQLRLPSNNKTLEKVFQVSQGVSVLMIGGAFIVTIIHKVPFNSMIIFICCQVLAFMFSTFTSIQAKLSENGQFLQRQQQQKEFQMSVLDTAKTDLSRTGKPFYRDFGAIYRQQFKRKNATEIAQQKKQLFLRGLWTTFASCITAMDFLSDMYYGLKIEFSTAREYVPLKIAGFFILCTAIVDYLIATFMIIKPQQVNHKSHILALLLEVSSFAGTAYSLYILLNKDGGQLTEQFPDGIAFAIFSLITTVIAVIVHGVYVVDYFFQKSAVEFMQQR